MSKGFTLIEVLLSVALLAIVISFSWPFLNSVDSNRLDVSVGQTVNTIRQAQSLAQTGNQDSSWGVFVGINSITLFKGDAYATRDVNYDQELLFEKGITASTTPEIVFTKHTGETSFVGDIDLVTSNQEVHKITIQALGVINY